MGQELILLLMFIGLFVGVFMGFPVALTMIGISIIVGFSHLGTTSFRMPGMMLNSVIGEWAYVAVPMFVFMGCMLEKSGAADNAFGVMNQWFRNVRGGLGISVALICVLFAACIGVLGASVTTVGVLALGPMIKRGYDKGFSTSIVAAGGSMGILLPPSIVLILFSSLAALSMFRLFVATIVPGILLALLYAIYAGIVGYIKPGIVPAVEKDKNAPLEYNLRQSLSSFLPFILLIFAVLGAMFLGLVSPTEVAAFGSLGSILVAMWNKKFNKTTFLDAAKQTFGVTAMVMLIAVGATMFTATFFLNGGRPVIRNILEQYNLGANGTFALFLIIIFVLGICVDWLGVSMIMVPIFMPILVEFGFDGIHVSVVALVLLQTSFLTPPFAQSILYALSVVPEGIKIQEKEVYRSVAPFIGIQLLVVAICIIFPGVVTFLPGLMLTGW
ncbi:MAG: TRAP transporter large permease subunit [Clostridiales bacterium]|nr:TRAP transporter large permease subunit [Clostridiales bacterium]